MIYLHNDIEELMAAVSFVQNTNRETANIGVNVVVTTVVFAFYHNMEKLTKQTTTSPPLTYHNI